MNQIPQTLTFCRSARVATPRSVVRWSIMLVVAPALLALSLAGCAPSPEQTADGDDPLAALRVSATSTRYDGRFWRLQHRQSPSRYAEAVAYCTAESEAGRLSTRPNCEPVLMADEFIRRTERELRGPRQEGRGYSGILSEDASGADAPSGDTAEATREREER